jgi:hypothetical protein
MKINYKDLFIKRITVTLIDQMIFLILLSFNIAKILNLPIIVEAVLNILIVFIIYYCIIPIVNNGQTLGSMIRGIKIIFLKKYTIFQKIYILVFRALYAFLTLYSYRMFLPKKMNNLGQLYFDERFNTSVILKTDEINSSENKSYQEVTFPPGLLFKMILYVWFLMAALAIVTNLIK